MTDRDATRRNGHATRRGVLAAAGAGLLAGCGGIGDTDDSATIRAFDLPEIDPDDPPKRPVPESVPVRLDPAEFAATRDRTTTLLAELPIPFGPGDVPNGYVRERLTHAASDASDALDAARTARTQWVASEWLRRARAEARYASAGWAVAENGRSAEPLRGEYENARSAVRTFRDERTYRGVEPVRATIVHAHIESLTRGALRDDPPRTPDGRLLDVAEWGRLAESTQARLDDARHVADQFDASLSSDATDLEARITDAAETLLADLREMTLPAEPTGGDPGIVEWTIGLLHGDASRGVSSVEEADGPADAVVDATERLAQFRALDRLQRRVDEGDLVLPESAEAVAKRRATAYDAMRRALNESSDPLLTRPVLADLGRRLVTADTELGRQEGEFRASRIDREAAVYAIVTAVARAAPEAAERAAEALRG